MSSGRQSSSSSSSSTSHTESKAEKKVDLNAAASKIQRFWRNKTPLFPPLPQDKTIDYGHHLLGNDPLELKGLEDFQVKDQPIALVATGGVRAIEFACRLGNKKYIPKVLIIDNSSCVASLWRNLRNYSQANENPIDFLKNLKSLLTADINLALWYRRAKSQFDKDTTDQIFELRLHNSREYFANLFINFGFDFVRNIIIGTLFINQNYEDVATFTKLKKVLNSQNIKNIFVYPSNILAYTKKATNRHLVCTNIALLNPKLSMHSDLVYVPATQGTKPDKFKLFTEQTPSLIKRSMINVDLMLFKITRVLGWSYNAETHSAICGNDLPLLEHASKVLTDLGFVILRSSHPITRESQIQVLNADKILECDVPLEHNINAPKFGKR